MEKYTKKGEIHMMVKWYLILKRRKRIQARVQENVEVVSAFFIHLQKKSSFLVYAIALIENIKRGYLSSE